MPLQQKAVQKLRSFDLPVSYKVNESRPRLRDALNVFSNQGRLETRFGRSLLASLGTSILSMSYFKTAAGVKYIIAKVGTEIKAYNINTNSTSTIKTGLSSTTKHRGFTWIKGSTSRHIISVESDGLFQFNGTTFTQLGQNAPSAPTVAAHSTTGSLPFGTYNVYLTYYSSTTGFESNKSAASSDVIISAQKIIQDLTYAAKLDGALGNLITVTYTAGGVLGSETITVTNNAINVTIASGATTANQIKTLIDKNSSAAALVSVTVSGTGTTAQTAVAATALTGGQQSINVTNLPATADNATIDKVRLYYKNASSVDDPVYVTEFALGTTSYMISAESESSTTAPIANAAPLSGGGKYLTDFNRKLVYAGNGTYKNDVFFSEEDLPDAFNDGTADDRLVLSPLYDGEITGLATGLYSNSVLDPYLVVFKKRSTHIYSEISGEGKFVPISDKIGCVSHESIVVKNGNIYFLSDQGPRAIENGLIVRNEMGNPAILGDGDIDDIFRQPGYVYEVNRSQMQNAFSVYYSTLDQYMTWVSEGSSTSFDKTYVYEYQLGGFKPYKFYSPSVAACVGEDSSGDEVVFMADSNGAVYTHSTKESRSDDDYLGAAQTIDAFAMLTWMDGDDMDASYNFRELILRRVASEEDLTVKTWINYNLGNLEQYSYDFAGNDEGGPVFDVSEWDEAVYSDERTIITRRADINRCGENILIGFYQNELNANLNLVAAQLEFNRNGNRNL
jgi:hypothetical protein